MLQAFKRCPFFFQEKYLNGNVIEIAKEYFLYGSAVDCLLTEKDQFDKRFLPTDRKIDTDGLKQTKSDLKELDKEITEKQLNEKPYKSLQDKKEKLMETIKKMEEAGEKEQITAAVYRNILDSVSELERQELYKMFRVEEMSQEIITIEACGDMPARKGKLDYINVGRKIIADIKTTANLTTFKPREYCQQLAYYRELAAVKHGISEEEWDCYLLVVDKSAEFKRSEIYHISKFLLDIAKEENHELIKRLMECQKLGFFMPCATGNIEARREKCFFCDHYPNCPFSIQKQITEIS